MRIQNGQPKLLQVNVHTFGALYGYNNETGIFDFISNNHDARHFPKNLL